MRLRLVSILTVCLLIAAAGWPAEARAPHNPAAQVVGDGHPETCTEQALFDALNLGGAISFNCGAAPKVIFFGASKTITTTASLNGGDLITLSGNNATRLFHITGGNSLSLRHIALTNAKSSGDGGAIINDNGATLVVDHAVFRHNVTDPPYSGGAILNLGNLSISDSTFEDNQAGNGGALYPRFAASKTTVTNSLFQHNSTLNTTSGWGGAMLIWDGAPVTVQGSQFISNTARWGGAFYVFPNSSLTLTNSLLSHNLADSGSTSADGGGGAIYSNARLVLRDTRLDDNLTVVPPGFGFSGIRAGGAIWNSSAGDLLMSGGDLRRNRALHGGAMYSLGNSTIISVTLADNLAGRGGAIENANNAGNGLTINDTTLSGNQVSFAVYPAIVTPLGGAIFSTAHLTVTNSTLSGNSGASALTEDNSVITLASVTLAQNANGGLSSDQSPNTSQVHLFNTLLADNGSNNCGPILFNAFTSQNGLSSDSSCTAWVGGQNQNGVDPQLSPLGYHAGPTFTHMLAADSLAVDAGAGCPNSDQRGVSRVVGQGLACDIGAVERHTNDAFYWLFVPFARR